MTTFYFAGVDDSGIVRKHRKLDDGDVLPPSPFPATPPSSNGITWYPISAQIDWSAQPSDTSVLKWNDGSPAWVETSPLADLITLALDQIDAACEAVRQAAVAKRTLKADEYAQAEAQATAWKATNYAGDAPQDVQSWANAKWRDLMTPQQAADDILTQAVEYRTLLSHIRALRLTDMENVRHATTTEEIDTILTQFLKDLASLGSP